MPPALSLSPEAAAVAVWATERALEPAVVLAGLHRAAVEHRGLEGVVAALPPPAGTGDPPTAVDLPISAEAISPDLLGEALGACVAGSRRHQGAVFTPRATVEGLVRVAFDELWVANGGGLPASVVDPSVGGGAFALAVARTFVARGVPAEDAVGRLVGVDADPLSVVVTRAALELWLAEQAPTTTETPVVAPRIQVGDFLLDSWSLPSGVDLVVGNPPFLSQLRRATTRASSDVAALRQRFGTAVGPYTDAASLFLLAGLDLLRPGGVLVLVEPRSFLAADGAGEVRRRLTDRAALVGLWEPAARVFAGAAIDVCAPVLVVGAPQPPEVRVWHDVDLAEAPHERHAATLLGDDPALGLASSRDDQPPMVALPPRGGRLGEHANVTAGFRDQFYGMAPYVHEAAGSEDPRPRLVTSGLIDPGLDRWGVRPARYARQTWAAPVVEVADLDPDARVGRWAAARLVPKLVVASQTKVIEVALDTAGRVIPSPPTISVEAAAEELPRLLAVLLAPATTAWLHRRAAGTGLAPDALRVSVADLVDVPLPGDEAPWQAATDLLLTICTGPEARPLGDDEPTRRFGQLMAEAYGLPPLTGDAVLAWWLARLPAASAA